jgi:HSP20 family molecular chaperone IbpA
MSALRDALRDLPETVFADLLESDDAYLLLVDVPGATAETTDVELTAGRLRIEARREKDLPAGFTYVEEDRDLFLDAQVPLPPDATGADAEGTMKRGVLELRLPKAGASPDSTVPITDVDA